MKFLGIFFLLQVLVPIFVMVPVPSNFWSRPWPWSRSRHISGPGLGPRLGHGPGHNFWSRHTVAMPDLFFFSLFEPAKSIHTKVDREMKIINIYIGPIILACLWCKVLLIKMSCKFTCLKPFPRFTDKSHFLPPTPPFVTKRSFLLEPPSSSFCLQVIFDNPQTGK